MKKQKGGINILVLIIVIILLGLGYFLLGNNKEEVNDISTSSIPTECQDVQDDVCKLFECMVNLCWCDDSSPELPILYETYITFNDEQGAKDAVHVYIAESIYGDNELAAEEAKKMKIKNVVKLNDVFYNVFVDKEGEEIVYTVSKNGQILKTICGV